MPNSINFSSSVFSNFSGFLLVCSLLSCSHQKLIKPIKIETTKKQETTNFNNQINIKFLTTASTPKNYESEVNRRIESLKRLFDDPVVKNIEIQFSDNLKRDHVSFKGEKTTLRLNNLSLLDKTSDTTTHELFHALYQGQKFEIYGRKEMERWATYAQLKLQNPEQNNDQILALITNSNTFNITEKSFLITSSESSRDLYNANSQSLFMATHSHNKALLNKLQTNASSRDYIKAIQAELNKRMNQHVSVDGVFGQDTSRSIGHFQSIHNLEINGKLDSATRDLLRF